MRENVIAVQRMQDYIEDHFKERITMAELSSAARFSPWHSYRIFKMLTGFTPADYIRRVRLSRSALALRDGKCRVTDLAFTMGFGSVDGYQRAFLREFGCNPAEYARNPVPISLFIPYGVKFREFKKEIFQMEKMQTVFIKEVRKPARKVIIKRGIRAEDYFPYCEEVGCEVWGILASMKSLSGEPVCLWLPERYRKENTSRYVQSVEIAVDDCRPLPAGFDKISLPASDYLLFQGEPFAEEDYCEAIQRVRYAMEQYCPAVLGYRWDDESPRIQLEPVGSRGYMEMRAVTRIDAP